MKEKIVNYPIHVPDSDYCWEIGVGQCRHFQMDGHAPLCKNGFYLEYIYPEENGGILKSKECTILE